MPGRGLLQKRLRETAIQGERHAMHAGSTHACTHAHARAHTLCVSARVQSPQARSFYVSGLVAGLRNDVTDEILSLRQRWRLADIRIEEYCFVLLSRVIGTLEEQVRRCAAIPLTR